MSRLPILAFGLLVVAACHRASNDSPRPVARQTNLPAPVSTPVFSPDSEARVDVSQGSPVPVPTVNALVGWDDATMAQAVDACANASAHARRSVDRRFLRTTCECLVRVVAARWEPAAFRERQDAILGELDGDGSYATCARRSLPGEPVNGEGG